MIKSALLSFLAVAACCALSILYLDRPILLYFEASREPYLPIFIELSRLGWGTTWFALAGGVLLAGVALRYKDSAQLLRDAQNDRHPAASESESAGPRALSGKLIRFGGFALASLVAAGIITRLLKWGIGRWRPKFFLDNGLYDFAPFSAEGAYKAASLPSGHSQTIATVCVVIALFKPKLTPYLLALALLVALSRMVLLQHYLADVLAGLWLGTIVPLLMWHYWHCQRAARKL